VARDAAVDWSSSIWAASPSSTRPVIRPSPTVAGSSRQPLHHPAPESWVLEAFDLCDMDV